MIKEINGVQYTIDEKLDNFTIKSKPSSNVAFYGVNHDATDIQLFVQFKNGSCYIYSGLTDQTLKELNECESIGSFISRNIVGKFLNIKCEKSLVMAVIETVQSVERLNRLVRNSQSTDVSFIEVNKNGDLTEPTF